MFPATPAQNDSNAAHLHNTAQSQQTNKTVIPLNSTRSQCLLQLEKREADSYERSYRSFHKTLFLNISQILKKKKWTN